MSLREDLHREHVRRRADWFSRRRFDDGILSRAARRIAERHTARETIEAEAEARRQADEEHRQALCEFLLAQQLIWARRRRLEAAKLELAAIAEQSRGKPLIHDIIKATALHYRVSIVALTSDTRLAKPCLARQVAMYVSRELSGKSLHAIARAVNKDHSTVYHAFKKIRVLIETDLVLAADVAAIVGAVAPGLELSKIGT